MIEAWIAFTIFAAVMQSVRTAGQKQLTSSVSAMSSTLIRYLFGLPFVIAYLIYQCGYQSTGMIAKALGHGSFVLFAIAASIAQIVATYLLVRAFGYRNFTVGTSFAKTEAVQTAFIGTLVFGSTLSFSGWVAIALGFIGVLIISIPGITQRWEPAAVFFGSLSGTSFALTSLFLREASLSLNLPVLQSAAITLAFMVSLQTCLCMLFTLYKEPEQFSAIRGQLPLSFFVGFTSAMGSVGWFTAMTYQNPALVKSLGQIEILFTMALTTLYFREKITVRELVGVLAITFSVVLIVMSNESLAD